MNANENVNVNPDAWAPATAEEIRAIRVELRGEASQRWLRIEIPSRSADGNLVNILKVGHFTSIDSARAVIPAAVAAVTFFLLTGSTAAVTQKLNDYGSLGYQLSKLRHQYAEVRS